MLSGVDHVTIPRWVQRFTPLLAKATHPCRHAVGDRRVVDETYVKVDQSANNRVEADHGRLKARLRPMRGRKQDRSARIVIAGHGFVQNLRRGQYELAAEEQATRRVAVAFKSSSWRSDPRRGVRLQHALAAEIPLPAKPGRGH
jgi:transposase-like protein